MYCTLQILGTLFYVYIFIIHPSVVCTCSPLIYPYSGLLEVYGERVPLQLARLLNMFREAGSSMSETGKRANLPHQMNFGPKAKPYAFFLYLVFLTYIPFFNKSSRMI
jgi:hypothetical protein